MSLNHDTSRLFVATNDGFKIFDFKTGEELCSPIMNSRVNRIHVTEDNHYLIAQGNDRLNIWPLNLGRINNASLAGTLVLVQMENGSHLNRTKVSNCGIQKLETLFPNWNTDFSRTGLHLAPIPSTFFPQPTTQVEVTSVLVTNLQNMSGRWNWQNKPRQFAGRIPKSLIDIS